MYDKNPVFAFILGLMFGQLYGSDLWVATKVILRVGGLFGSAEPDSSAGSACIVFLYVLVLASFIPFVIGQILPPIIDNFALPFTFFFAMFGVNIDDNKYEFDKEKGDEDNPARGYSKK